MEQFSDLQMTFLCTSYILFPIQHNLIVFLTGRTMFRQELCKLNSLSYISITHIQYSAALFALSES